MTERREIAREEALQRLENQRERAEELKSLPRKDPAFKKWRRDTEVLIEYIFGPESRHVDDFKGIRYSLGAYSTSTPEYEFQAAYHRGLENARQTISSMQDEIESFWVDSGEAEEGSAFAPLRRLELLADRFHLVARRLRARYSGRTTLDVRDEYDVQDLLHALLSVDFEDIRPEEVTPSNAGAGSRQDFLLPEHGIVVEVKKTRDNLRDKQLGEQLIIDIARYESHPDCHLLFCFVYDPDGFIGNPRGLERDLESREGGVEVRVIIAPR